MGYADLDLLIVFKESSKINQKWPLGENSWLLK